MRRACFGEIHPILDDTAAPCADERPEAPEQSQRTEAFPTDFRADDPEARTCVRRREGGETLSGKFASDLLRGADAIAEFLFGHRRHRRKVYHLAETSRLPVFRLGAVLCARRSVLLAWVAEQEKRGARGMDPGARIETP